jgi:DNA-binding IclR family transcriptional regulator
VNKHKTNKIVKTLRLLGQCEQEGEGKITLRDVSFWSGINRMTTYRKLVELETIGIVERTKHPHRNTEIHYWNLTVSGLELAEQKDLL